MRDRTDLDALTMRVIDLEQWRRRLEHRVPPCPWWYTETLGDHQTDHDSQVPGEPDALSRIHACVVGALRVVQTETNRAGVVTLDPPEARLYEEEIPTAERARQLARDFAAAADLLDRINGEKAGA